MSEKFNISIVAEAGTNGPTRRRVTGAAAQVVGPPSCATANKSERATMLKPTESKMADSERRQANPAVDVEEFDTDGGGRQWTPVGKALWPKEVKKKENQLRWEGNEHKEQSVVAKPQRMNLLNNTWSTDATTKFGPRVVNKGQSHVKVVQQLTSHQHEKRVNESKITAQLKAARLSTIIYQGGPPKGSQRAHSTVREQTSSFPGVVRHPGIGQAQYINAPQAGFGTPSRTRGQITGHQRSGSGQAGTASEANQTVYTYMEGLPAIGKHRLELIPAGISSGPTMAAQVRQAGLASTKAHLRTFGAAGKQFGSVDEMKDAQPGSETDMFNGPSLMNSDALDAMQHTHTAQTHSELPQHNHFDFQLSGEMSTMRQMLDDAQLQDASVGSGQPPGNVHMTDQRRDGATWQSQRTGNFISTALKIPHAAPGSSHHLPFAATASTFHLASRTTAQSSQPLTQAQLSPRASFYYDRAKQRPAFMRRVSTKKDSLKDRKQSVQAVLVGGERMKAIIQDREKRRQEEKQGMGRWRSSVEEEQSEEDVVNEVRHKHQKNETPCSWKNNSKKSTSVKKSPTKTKYHSGSSDSDSGESVPRLTPGLTPGAVDDTAESRLFKKIIRMLKRQEEPNLSAIAELRRAAQKGPLQLTQLQLQHQSLKRQEDLRAKEAFANAYDDTIKVGLNPLENKERYLMSETPKQMIKFMDNVIYYKHKMIKLGKRGPEESDTFLNKRKATGLTIGEARCNRFTRRYQNQPSDVCEVAKIASRLLYQIYVDDKGFVVDSLEKARLGIGSQDRGRFTGCEEHGGESAAKRENKRQAYLQAIEFYEDLKDPRHNKVDRELQARALIERIRTSTEIEFVELRKELFDDGERRSMKYEELRKLRPAIFIKNEEPIDNWGSANAEDILEPQSVTAVNRQALLAPDTMTIVANHMILQTFTNTFTAQEGSRNQRPRQLETAGSKESISFDEAAGNKVQICREDFEKLKFYEQQKQICLNPQGVDTCEHNFLKRLEGTIQLPLFTKIQGGVLKLQGYLMDKQMIDALTRYIEEDFRSEKITAKGKLVEHLIIDGGNFQDGDFAKVLRAVVTHKTLKSISYSNNEFGAESNNALEQAFVYCPNIDSLCLSNLKITQSKTEHLVLQQLLKTLNALGSNLAKLKLQQLDLNTETIQKQLRAYIALVKGPQDLDLSFCTIRPSHLMGIAKTLRDDGTKCKYLNLSYLNVGSSVAENPDTLHNGKQNISTKGQQPQTNYVASFVEHLCDFIEQKDAGEDSKLVHLDLSGMNLKEHIRPLLISVHKSSRKHRSRLMSIHLNDNDFEQSTKEYIIRKMRIYSNDQDKLLKARADPARRSAHETESSSQRRLQMLAHSFFKMAKPSSEVDQDAGILNHGIVKHFANSKAEALASVEPAFGKQRHVNDPFVLTRKLGHPELLFNEDRFTGRQLHHRHAKGYWKLESGAQGDDCYICQQYSYLQLYFRPSTASSDFKKLEDPKLIKILRESCNLDQNGKVPFLLSSFNNWLPTRLIDIKIFCGLLKAAAPSFVKQSKRQTSSESESSANALRTEYEKNLSRVEKDRFEHKSNKERLEILREYEIKKEQANVQSAAENLREAADGESMYGYSQLLGINPYDSLIEKYLNTSRGWKSIINSCLSYKSDMRVLNFPEEIDESESIFTFAGFVRPGRHAMIIYDPPSSAFYQQDVLVEPRRGEILQQHCTLDLAEELKVRGEEYIDPVDHLGWLFRNQTHESNEKLALLFEEEISVDFLGSLEDEVKYRILDHLEDNYKLYYKVHQMCRMGDIEGFDLPNELEELGVDLDWSFRDDEGHGQAGRSRRQFIYDIYLGCLNSSKSSSFEDSISRVTRLLESYYAKHMQQLDPMQFRLHQLWAVNMNKLLELNYHLFDNLFSLYSTKRKITYKQALKLIEDVQVNSKSEVIDGEKKPNVVNVRMCFEQSKQFGNQGSALGFLEFVEFVCRVANEEQKEEIGGQLVAKVYAFLVGKVAVLTQRGDVKNVVLGKGELDPLIFEVEEAAAEIVEEKEAKPRKVIPAIPSYQRYAQEEGFWQLLARQLPTSATDEEQVKRRRELWKKFDLNGNGFVSLGEAHAGMRYVLPDLKLREAREAIASAFELSKGLSSAKKENVTGPRKDDRAQHYLDRAEFRAFLAALRSHLVCQHAFTRLDSGGDGRIDRTEFLAAVPVLEEWTGPLADADQVFTEIDADGAGAIRFAEFCTWAVRRQLDGEDDDDLALEVF